MQTGRVNKVGVVSTSGLNENLEKKKKVKQICILPEEFSISLKDLKRACCTVKIRWTMRAIWLACRNNDSTCRQHSQPNCLYLVYYMENLIRRNLYCYHYGTSGHFNQINMSLNTISTNWRKSQMNNNLRTIPSQSLTQTIND